MEGRNPYHDRSPRVIFPQGEQQQFLSGIQEARGYTLDVLARIARVTARTVRLWKHEGTSMPLTAVEMLCTQTGRTVPKNVEVRERYWYVTKGARKGALARMEIYGPPGTPEGRRNGGHVSQLRRRQNPELYRKLGCNMRRTIHFPLMGPELAECIGILMGDGGISPYQVNVTLHRWDDWPYAQYVLRLLRRLFGNDVAPSTHLRESVVQIVISRRSLVEYLHAQWGLPIGVRSDRVSICRSRSSAFQNFVEHACVG